MARPARAKTHEGQTVLDARLKGLFDAVKAEPVPARLLRHVLALDGQSGKPAKKR